MPNMRFDSDHPEHTNDVSLQLVLLIMALSIGLSRKYYLDAWHIGYLTWSLRRSRCAINSSVSCSRELRWRPCALGMLPICRPSRRARKFTYPLYSLVGVRRLQVCHVQRNGAGICGQEDACW